MDKNASNLKSSILEFSALLFAFSLSFDPDWSSKAMILLFGAASFNLDLDGKTLVKSRSFKLLIITLVYITLNMVFLSMEIAFKDYRLIGTCLLFFLLGNQTKFWEIDLDKILVFFAGGVFVVGLVNSGAYLLQIPAIDQIRFNGEWESVSVIDIQKIYFAAYVDMAYLIMAQLFLDKKIKGIVVVISACFSLMLLLFTGAMSGMGIFILINVAMIFRIFTEKKYKVVSSFLIVLPLIIMSVLTLSGVQNVFVKLDGDGSRIRNYNINKEIIVKSPLFGFGIGKELEKMQSVRGARSWEYLNKYNAHNQYFQFIIGGGIFYCFLVLLLPIFAQMNFWKQNRYFLVNGFGLVILYVCLIESFLVRHHGVLFFSYFIGLFLSYKKNYLVERLLEKDNPIGLIKKKCANGQENEKGISTFLNPYSYLYYRKHMDLFRMFDKMYIDGMALIYMLKLIGIKLERKSFDMTSLAPIVFNSCIRKRYNVFFIGSTKESIQEFISIINDKYYDLNIVGYRDGYFHSKEEKMQFMIQLFGLNPDVIIAGMGTPYQEQFLVDMKLIGWNGVGYTCGGFVHQTAKGINYYPEFYNKYNLRWVYRMFDEPKLLTRYFVFYPISAFLFIADYICFWLLRKPGIQ